jgi:hypothetical protein
MDPLPNEVTPEMRDAFDVLVKDDRYPLPAGQAALWAVLSDYALDPVSWATQLLDLANQLLEE